MIDPLRTLLTAQKCAVLDGGLAVILAMHGADLSSKLWSAAQLIDAPEKIEAAHKEYYEAGADICISSSYQASFEGFELFGVCRNDAKSLMQLSVDLVKQARDKFWSEHSAERKLKPLVAASIGCFGAFLADGSEYTGQYDLTVQELMNWHRPRIQAILSSSPDLLACETIPCLNEVRALTCLINEFPGIFAWITVSCRDGYRLRNGESLSDMYSIIANEDTNSQISGIGINCTHPNDILQCIENLVESMNAFTTSRRRAIVVYPNSGKEWDGEEKKWIEGTSLVDNFATLAVQWRDAGADVIGGCCEVGPTTISCLRKALNIDSIAYFFYFGTFVKY